GLSLVISSPTSRMRRGPKSSRPTEMPKAPISKLNPMRAYCVALSTAFTVIVASWLGLPVSTTHSAVGAVFGGGFV
ncbi:inorganic phosphate transporter, partial [Rhizobium leguminosarum]|uniref:inorganic phosphate transporter n=1 Tax=Rhizobium leguminosarum TaxID=384 RepID=UPI003F9A5D49